MSHPTTVGSRLPGLPPVITHAVSRPREFGLHVDSSSPRNRWEDPAVAGLSVSSLGNFPDRRVDPAIRAQINRNNLETIFRLAQERFGAGSVLANGAKLVLDSPSRFGSPLLAGQAALIASYLTSLDAHDRAEEWKMGTDPELLRLVTARNRFYTERHLSPGTLHAHPDGERLIEELVSALGRSSSMTFTTSSTNLYLGSNTRALLFDFDGTVIGFANRNGQEVVGGTEALRYTAASWVAQGFTGLSHADYEGTFRESFERPEIVVLLMQAFIDNTVLREEVTRRVGGPVSVGQLHRDWLSAADAIANKITLKVVPGLLQLLAAADRAETDSGQTITKMLVSAGSSRFIDLCLKKVLCSHPHHGGPVCLSQILTFADEDTICSNTHNNPGGKGKGGVLSAVGALLPPERQFAMPKQGLFEAAYQQIFTRAIRQGCTTEQALKWVSAAAVFEDSPVSACHATLAARSFLDGYGEQGAVSAMPKVIISPDPNIKAKAARIKYLEAALFSDPGLLTDRHPSCAIFLDGRNGWTSLTEQPR